MTTIAHATGAHPCPSDQDDPGLHVGPGARMLDADGAPWCVHDDPRLDLPAGTELDLDGAPTAPPGWAFTLEGLTAAEEPTP